MNQHNEARTGCAGPPAEITIGTGTARRLLAFAERRAAAAASFNGGGCAGALATAEAADARELADILRAALGVHAEIERDAFAAAVDWDIAATKPARRLKRFAD